MTPSSSPGPDSKLSPQLRQAALEIEAICRKYDCCATYSLGNRTHAQSGVYFSTWSTVQLHGESEWGIGFHFKTEPENTAASIGLVFSFRDHAAACYQAFDKLATVAQEHAQVDHQPFGGPGGFLPRLQLERLDRREQPSLLHSHKCDGCLYWNATLYEVTNSKGGKSALCFRCYKLKTGQEAEVVDDEVSP